jgi:hypothetical protein
MREFRHRTASLNAGHRDKSALFGVKHRVLVCYMPATTFSIYPGLNWATKDIVLTLVQR